VHAAFDDKIDRLLSMPPYVSLLRKGRRACWKYLRTSWITRASGTPAIRTMSSTGPVDYRSAGQVADLPFLPVGILKANPPLSFVGPDEIKRTLTSSATTSQCPAGLCSIRRPRGE
jgi:hypothetical protein